MEHPSKIETVKYHIMTLPGGECVVGQRYTDAGLFFVKEENTMWLLFGTTITTSFFDSLNPSAIAQQMLLQALLKNKRQIWFFILGIGTANLALGLAIYYGIATWVSELLSKAIEVYPMYTLFMDRNQTDCQNEAQDRRRSKRNG